MKYDARIGNSCSGLICTIEISVEVSPGRHDSMARNLRVVLACAEKVVVLNKIVAIANQKRGEGKTTTLVNLETCLADLGCRVLLLDMDPQGNATSRLGVDRSLVERATYDLLMGDARVE